mmetsp:Transcript_5569/g.6248  ORF Transcript_5569/g.6248 Transcript_5569/m.6248 type:complete len:82 (-) Transcript_5569:25-270(-)
MLLKIHALLLKFGHIEESYEVYPKGDLKDFCVDESLPTSMDSVDPFKITLPALKLPKLQLYCTSKHIIQNITEHVFGILQI